MQVEAPILERCLALGLQLKPSKAAGAQKFGRTGSVLFFAKEKCAHARAFRVAIRLPACPSSGVTAPKVPLLPRGRLGERHRGAGRREP